MKKRVNRLICSLSSIVLVFASLASFSSCSKSDVLELNVYNAEEYISSSSSSEDDALDVITEFENYATKKYGKKVKVNYSTFGTLENMYNELQLTKKKSDDGGYTYAYDLVCPSDYMIQRMIREDMLEPFDCEISEDGKTIYDVIDNYNNYASKFIVDLFDFKEEKNNVTCSVKRWSEYAVCYMWGTMGFIYNPVKLVESNAKILDKSIFLDDDGNLKLDGKDLENALDGIVNTWSLPWNTYYKNLGTIKDSIRDTYALAIGYVYSSQLLALQTLRDQEVFSNDEYQNVLIKVFNNVSSSFSEEFKNLNLTDSQKSILSDLFKDDGIRSVDKVAESLKDLKTNVYGFEVDSGKKDMAAGKIAINFAWSGDAAYTLDTADDLNGATLYYSVPKEGSNIWFDAWVMPKGVSGVKKQLAQDFVNFLSSPEIAIANMDYIGYVSPIANEDVFQTMLQNYDLTLTETSENTTKIDYSYYFDKLSNEYKMENGIGESVVVYSSPSNIGRQLTTQYPEQETVERCAIMTALSRSELKDLNEMWSDVKVGNIPVWLLILIPCLIGAIVLIVVLYATLKTRGVSLFNRSKKNGTIIKSERL